MLGAGCGVSRILNYATASFRAILNKLLCGNADGSSAFLRIRWCTTGTFGCVALTIRVRPANNAADDDADDGHDDFGQCAALNRCHAPVTAAAAVSSNRAMGSTPTSSRCGRSVAEAVPWCMAAGCSPEKKATTRTSSGRNMFSDRAAVCRSISTVHLDGRNWGLRNEHDCVCLQTGVRLLYEIYRWSLFNELISPLPF